METNTDIIKIGKYTFEITETKMIYGTIIISHTFKIGGDYNNCISVSYTYKNNKPITAKIPHALYEPECSIGSNLEKGPGTILMLKTLLRYSYNKIPEISTFEFDDMSHIDCIPKDMSKSPPRPSSKPLSLSYLSIAYNSKTWYEEKFNAIMTDHITYKNYRDKITFLEMEDKKPSFIDFLQIAQPPKEQYEYLESIYNTSKTYRDFFNKIPKSKRCDILLPWLVHFLNHYLKGIFSTNGWEINVKTMNSMEGGKTRNKRYTRKNKLYPSNYNIINYKEYHMI
jgi:hypothetical protein